MKKYFNWTVFLFCSVFFSAAAFAADADMPLGDFLGSLLNYVKEFKNFSLEFKVAGALTLILSTIKVSALRGLLWDKWGSAKVLVAPALALVVGVLSLEHVTFKTVLEYMGTVGGGAIVIHQLLDALKAKFGDKAWVQTVVGFLQAVIPNGLQAKKE